MNPSNRFDCHSYLDNTTLAILEISTKVNFSDPTSKSYHWLLINKSTLQVKVLQLHSRDDSTYVQERFFDIGYLKYDANTGVFIPQNSQELHPLENLTCNDIPKILLKAVENYLCVV
jgi:hypothetical protein